MGKDLWGGMFDFNGDGKTTWDEEMLGFSILEENRKRTAKNLQSRPAHKYREPENKSIPTIKEVPNVVDESNYKSLCSEYRTECICAIVALIIMLIPAIFILWAVYSTYDPKNSASDFITIVFTLAGLVYGGIVVHTTFNSINTSIKNLNLVKERYSGTEVSQKTIKIKWLLLLLLPLFIGLCIFSNSNNSEKNDRDFVVTTTTYTSPNSNNSTVKTKRINTEPAMTKEEAERLRGTGYHGTRPNSLAEEIELKAAQVKCKKCGMRSHNGANSLCDECQYNEKYGLD